jgi:prepilin-type N-terminal cleavage/methylation domain-containing protein
MTKSNNKGFTLLEILLVVGAIGILAGIVILAINPGKQLGDTRNAQRKADVSTLSNAVYQYAIDNNGNFPASNLITASTTAQVIGSATTGCNTVCTATTTVASCLNLTTDLTPTYVVGIPKDPTSGTDPITDYYIRKLNTGRIVVGSCDPEQGEVITVER